MKKTPPAAPVVRVDNVTKTFTTGGKKGSKLYVLRGIALEVSEGEIVAVVGESGAGKSTLLHIIGTLDRPSSGRVLYDNTDVFQLADEELARFRNRRVGFVFQFHHLLPEFTSLENVMMPAFIRGDNAVDCRDRALNLLRQVGIEKKADVRPGELSGGEQQRIALARALMNTPAMILADEPTGNLDTANASALHDLFMQLRNEQKQTFVIVTHNEALAKMADRILRIRDGVVHAE